MTRLLPMLAVSLLACSDYDLSRGKEATQPGEDTGTRVDGPVPDIEVRPDSLSFGTLPKDCLSDPKDVELENVGDGDLEIDAIELVGSGYSSFSHTAAAPLTLAPGEIYSFQVWFSPTAWSDFDIDVRVSSNDPDEAEVDVPTTGTGGEDAIYDEIFYQDFNETVDVLWIVDNSGSMSDALNQVTLNFSSFIDQFIDLDLDYHLGVVTTDMFNPAQSGRLQGPATYITAADPDPVGSFLAAVDQGDEGSGKEEGFGATWAALNEPLLNGFNAGFLRADASLATIVVSDENDDTDTLDPNSFSSWFNGLKTDPSKATFSAVCGDEGIGCTEWISFPTEVISASGGGDYIEAASLTGGVWQSICTTDFDRTLQHLSLTAAGMTDTWVLTRVPSNIGQTVVEVNGVEVDYNGVDGWTYSVSDNSITFHDEAVPPADAVIEVAYPYASECN